jgi:PAS domain S-box-containing protein
VVPSPTLEEANRCTRDLIALSTLPAVWLGAKPLRIAESLLAAIDTTVGPTLGYIRIPGAAGEPPIEVAHRDGAPVVATKLGRLGVTIQEWAATHDPDDILVANDGAHSGPMRICVYPLGSDREAGLLAAGFTSAAEPTAFQRTLLNLAANQAVVACQNSALQRKQADLYTLAEKEIVDRKMAEAALRASETRFRAAFENAPMGIALVNLDGRFLRTNEAMSALTGYSQAELMDKTFGEMTHPEDAVRSEASSRQLIAGEISTYAAEKRYVRKNGSFVWVNVAVALLRDAKGAPQSFIKLIENIDERKRKEETLRFLVDLNAAAQGLTDPAVTWTWIGAPTPRLRTNGRSSSRAITSGACPASSDAGPWRLSVANACA